MVQGRGLAGQTVRARSRPKTRLPRLVRLLAMDPCDSRAIPGYVLLPGVELGLGNSRQQERQGTPNRSFDPGARRSRLARPIVAARKADHNGFAAPANALCELPFPVSSMNGRPCATNFVHSVGATWGTPTASDNSRGVYGCSACGSWHSFFKSANSIARPCSSFSMRAT